MCLFKDDLPGIDGALLHNGSGSDYESSDSEFSSEEPPLPPTRIESLGPQDDYEDEESSVSESDSDDNESPPPLPPPRDLNLTKTNEYAV